MAVFRLSLDKHETIDDTTGSWHRVCAQDFVAYPDGCSPPKRELEKLLREYTKQIQDRMDGEGCVPDGAKRGREG